VFVESLLHNTDVYGGPFNQISSFIVSLLEDLKADQPEAVKKLLAAEV